MSSEATETTVELGISGRCAKMKDFVQKLKLRLQGHLVTAERTIIAERTSAKETW